LINEALQTAWAQADDAMAAQVEAEELRKLLATVNEKWLRGAWISAGTDAASCGNGEAVWFENGHVLEGGLGRGRWTLTQDKLHLTGDGFDATGTISAADPISFRLSWEDGTTLSLRRCTRAEVETLPEASESEVAE
ncbi:MAG: hypothetical protein ABW128_00135, partial [Rhizorhabdus sp.]